jgi:glycine cleavage system aminomethyltransferase T
MLSDVAIVYGILRRSDEGGRIGQVPSAVWSPDLKTNVAIAMIEASHWDAGAEVEVVVPNGKRGADVRALPFI